MTEAFKPIAIQAPGSNPMLFRIRCLLDFQLLTVFNFLRTELSQCRGKLLDVGAGQAPWRELVQHATYTGLDVDSASEFGMQRVPDVVYYDGKVIPFDAGSFDHVLCSEVLEHVPDAQAFLAELARVLRKGGTLVLTIPWSARLHHLPHDYRRLTRYGLADLIGAAGFAPVRIEERGNDVAAVANKIIVMMIRLLRPRRVVHAIWGVPLALLIAPVAAGFTIAAHVAIRFGLGAREDPLGYGVVAQRL